jgi:hypothetical protein
MEPQEHGDLAARLPEDLLTDVIRRLAATPRWLAVSRCVCKAWRAIIDGESLLNTRLRFLASAVEVLPDGACQWEGDHFIYGHCNGLILLRDYVVNLATQRWDPLPRRPRKNPKGMVGHLRCNEHLVFDHTVSSHYQVFRIPSLHPLRIFEDKFDSFKEASEWPPFQFALHVFSSRTHRWEERSFIRQGDAAGTVASMREHPTRRLSVYYRGSLYVHCQNNFLIRY